MGSGSPSKARGTGGPVEIVGAKESVLEGQQKGDESPSDVLRARRLEVVDDAGTVRAVVGTREEGIGGLTVFDAAGRKRAALEAGEVEGQGSGLSLFDANGKVRAVLYAHNEPGKGAAVYVNDEAEKSRAVLGVHEGGQATLVVNAG